MIEAIEPCGLNLCPGIAPDAQAYSIQDSPLFNSAQVDVIVTCPVIVNLPIAPACPPGRYPKVVSYPPGTFVIPLNPRVAGQPVYLSMQGCQRAVSRILPTTATDAEIVAAANAIIKEIAQQRAECDEFPYINFTIPANSTPAPTIILADGTITD